MSASTVLEEVRIWSKGLIFGERLKVTLKETEGLVVLTVKITSPIIATAEVAYSHEVLEVIRANWRSIFAGDIVFLRSQLRKEAKEYAQSQTDGERAR